MLAIKYLYNMDIKIFIFKAKKVNASGDRRRKDQVGYVDAGI